MVKVVPAILPQDFSDLKDHLDLVLDFVETVQIDVADGDFAPTITWPYSAGEEGPTEPLPYKDSLELEIDLLVADPISVADSWVDMGAKAIILHLETLEDPALLIEDLKLRDIKVGLSINPSTKSEILEKWIKEADFVQLMGNDEIGHQGVELDQNIYDKIKDLRKKYPKHIISVDIGVNFKTAPKLIKAGANKLVSGSAIFENKDIKKAIKKLSGK